MTRLSTAKRKRPDILAIVWAGAALRPPAVQTEANLHAWIDTFRDPDSVRSEVLTLWRHGRALLASLSVEERRALRALWRAKAESELRRARRQVAPLSRLDSLDRELLGVELPDPPQEERE